MQLAGLYSGDSYNTWSKGLMEGFESVEQARARYKMRCLGQLDRYPVTVLDWDLVTREIRGSKELMIPMRPPHDNDKVELFRIENGRIAGTPFMTLDRK